MTTNSAPAFPPISELYTEVFRSAHRGIALVDRGRRISYRELAPWVGQLISAFDRIGLRPGDRIGLALQMGADYLALQVAAQIAGLCTVDLPPALSVDALRHRVIQAGVATIVLCTTDFRERAAEVCDGLPGRKFGVGASFGLEDIGAIAGNSTPSALIAREHKGPAFVAYTSGSTGAPKAAAFSASVPSAQALTLMATLDYPRRPITVSCTPHPVISAMQVIPTMLRGGTVVTCQTFDLEPMLAAAQAERANVLFLPTQLLYVLLGRNDTAWLRGQVELFFYGGESMTPARLRELVERFGPVFAQAYGAMEAGPACVLRPQDHDPDDPLVLGSMGRPLYGTTVQVLGPDLVAVGANEVGRIAIRSPAAMLGYLGQPEQTSETIVDGAVLNGDVGYRDERGFVHLVDRSNFAVERDGRTIYPRTIERNLADHEAVQTAVVMQIGAADRKLLCGVAVLQRDATATPEMLNAHLARLSDSRLDGILCVRDLPLNPVTGKADRNAIKSMLESQFGRDT